MHAGSEVEMSRKRTEIQEAAEAPGLDINQQDIADSIQDELLIIDKKYRVKWANSAALPSLHKNSESPVDKLCYEVSLGRDKPCGAPLWDCQLKKVFDNGETTAVIHPVRTLGTETYMKVITYPLRDKLGNTTAVIELRRDVSTDRELDAQILKRHNQLLALNRISNAVSGFQDLDTILNAILDDVLEIVNGTIGGILLTDTESDTLYYRAYRGLSTKYVDRVRIPLGDGITGSVAKTGEPMLLEDISKDPRTLNVDLVTEEQLRGFISIPLKAKDEVVGVMNVASHQPGRFGEDDVALLNSIGNYLGTAIEQSSLNARLSRIGERNRALLKHALTVQEEERKRIARELHDETSQAITSLTLSLQAAIQMAEMKGVADEGFIERLKKAHSYAVHAGNETVKIMKELRPTLLDELGMSAAIHRYAIDSLETRGINVSMEFSGTEDRVPPEVEVTLFRTAQGLIGNILEHSEAKNVSIKLECSTGECTLYVEDDGKGFDVSKLTGVESSGRGAGLFTIRGERLRLMGGMGLVDSTPGEGTKATARVPLASIKDDVE